MWKNITTVVRDLSVDGDHLEVAAGLAERFGGHLHVIALAMDRVTMGAFYAGGAGMTLETNFAEAAEAAREAKAAVEDRLARRMVSWDIGTVVAQIGALGHVVGQHAFLADVVVLPKPYGESRTVEDVAILEACLFSTRTPVLVVPPGMTAVERPATAVVAWNHSHEALAAIRGAMPLLVDADFVEIVVIDPPEHAPDRSDPGGPLAEMMSRHGIHADIAVLARTLPRVSDVICRHTRDKGGDLVVMGAYGHSRFRESILGGATRNMLEQAEVPVLMAH